MLIDLESIGDEAKIYHLLMQAVVPRPVAWVLSDNGRKDGADSWNLAPFSMFQAVSTDPPMLIVCIDTRGLTTKAHKDTWENISNRSGLTIHVASFDLLDSVVKSSASLPRGVSEVAALGLSVTPMDGWPVPRLTEAPLAISAETEFSIEVGQGPQRIVFCRIRQIWASDQIATVIPEKNDRLVLDVESLNPIARLGGGLYGQIANVTTVQRPMSADGQATAGSS
jgi:flavin reductase (DIM6/NTAB) family NADH-FMN oxidoreductase RutF